MVQHWKVVGGADKGGIVVRQGKDLKSEQENDRLSTDSVIRELGLVGSRLNYTVVTGKGPHTGWVSIALSGKPLCVKMEDDLGTAEGSAAPAPPQRMTLDYQQSDACRARCEAELAKKTPAWTYISQQVVMENHMRVKPGLFYGLDFPFTEKMLFEMGPKWLTKALHAAGTLEKDNAVTEIIPENKIKITTGNNGGKFLFEVRYKKQGTGLHTKLFAKVPHPCEGKTMSDRISTSVNKQPMELYELNSSRLLEATLPVKIPKFYFGDISNETSNFILITEQVPFADPEPLDYEGKLARSGRRNASLPPHAIEGPYDKCMDWTLRGQPFEYYLLLVRTGAKMAGLHKAGKMGDPEALASHFENFSNMRPEMFGMKPQCTGGDPKMHKAKVDAAVRFMGEDAKQIFPSFCADKSFQTKIYNVLMTLNAYSAETAYWRHSDQDYISLTHNNLNVDNAFFWRNEEGEMELGVLDWGSTGQRSLGFKMWWWLYCSDFDVLTEKMDDYLQCFVDTYAEYGGPVLDKAKLKNHFIITAMEQMQGLCAAVPQIFRMCPKKQWPDIKDRYDSRIGLNIDGKSTLRLYLHVMNTIANIIQDPRWKGDQVLEQFIEDFCKLPGARKKDPSTIFP
jgi:hypothetical protein